MIYESGVSLSLIAYCSFALSFWSSKLISLVLQRNKDMATLFQLLIIPKSALKLIGVQMAEFLLLLHHLAGSGI